MKLERYLINEKTFNINADVDLFFNKLVKPTFKLLKKGKYKEFDNIVSKNKGFAPLEFMSSSMLKSKQARQAHKVNPISLDFCADKKGNYYSPIEKVIHISYAIQAFDMLRQNDYDMDTIERVIGYNSTKRFKNEFSEASIKGSIHHELSHWLDDSLHNFHISRVISVAAEQPDRSVTILKQGHADVGQTFYEIEAQIHALKELKRTYKKIWDTLTWKDIAQLKPSFSATFKQASLSGEYDKYMKNLIKRMHREKLLGKSMRNYPTYDEMYSIMRRI